MLCDTGGTPLRFLLSGAQGSDISYAQPLLNDFSIPLSQRGRARKRCKWLFADKGYDAEALHRYCDQYRIRLGASFSNHPKHALKYAHNVATSWK
ncbi:MULTISPECIES: transposase [unclassified Pseudomonas]|uniref:transposase n=1 Tax=unclassified Pseudomonas TaxID=196821 RepID=UPI0011AEFC5F